MKKNIAIIVLLLLSQVAFGDIMQTVRLAEKGDIKAQLVLAYMYEHGEVVSQSDEEAVKWYTRAAERGSAKAQLILGYKYDLGDGAPQDYRKAFKWYHMAAKQGSAKAQDNLAGMYTFGEGVPVDYVNAYAWYNIAASSGFPMAEEDRDFLANKMTPSQIEKGQELSKKIFASIQERVKKNLK